MTETGIAFEITRPILSVDFLVVVLFVFCYFGEKLTTEYEKIEHTVYQTTWYLMPIEMQKKIPSLLAITYRTVHLCGFANIQCTHEFFKRVNI